MNRVRVKQSEVWRINVLCGDRVGQTSSRHLPELTEAKAGMNGWQFDQSVGEMTAHSEADSRSATLRPNLRLFLSFSPVCFRRTLTRNQWRQLCGWVVT